MGDPQEVPPIRVPADLTPEERATWKALAVEAMAEDEMRRKRRARISQISDLANHLGIQPEDLPAAILAYREEEKAKNLKKYAESICSLFS